MSSRIHQPALTLLAVMLLLVGTTGEAQAGFMFVSESAVFNPATGEVQFTIEFNQHPDFFTLDSVGRQADSFQYFIVGDPSLPYPENYDAIIRGEEIHITGDTLRIRNSAPPNPDPASGGWGAIRGSVPFSLDGNVLTFSTPLPLISDHSTDGHFAYRLESYVFGGTTRSVVSQSTVVPEPFTAVLLAMAGVTLGCWYGGTGVLRYWARRMHWTRPSPNTGIKAQLATCSQA
jgi:hypothetical protein